MHVVPLFATPGQAIAHYQALSDAGVQFFLCLINGRDEETVQLLADVVIPAVKPAPVSGVSRAAGEPPLPRSRPVGGG